MMLMQRSSYKSHKKTLSQLNRTSTKTLYYLPATVPIPANNPKYYDYTILHKLKCELPENTHNDSEYNQYLHSVDDRNVSGLPSVKCEEQGQ